MSFSTPPRNPIVFEYSYIPFPISQIQSDEVVASRIIKIRLIFRNRYAAIGDGPISDAGATSDTYYSDSLKQIFPTVHLCVESVSRFPGAPHVTRGSFLPSDGWQNADGWIDVATPYASHHKIRVSVMGTLVGDIYDSHGLIKDFIRLEVEYETAADTGSAYIA
jgi:hypothetical protein